MAKLKLERQSIQCFLEKRDEKNKYTISGKERKDVNGWNSVLGQKIVILSEGKKLVLQLKVQSN